MVSFVCIDIMCIIYSLTVCTYAVFMLELDTEKEGCISYTAPEDAQRPMCMTYIPTFEVFNQRNLFLKRFSNRVF